MCDVYYFSPIHEINETMPNAAILGIVFVLLLGVVVAAVIYFWEARHGLDSLTKKGPNVRLDFTGDPSEIRDKILLYESTEQQSGVYEVVFQYKFDGPRRDTQFADVIVGMRNDNVVMDVFNDDSGNLYVSIKTKDSTENILLVSYAQDLYTWKTVKIQINEGYGTAALFIDDKLQDSKHSSHMSYGVLNNAEFYTGCYKRGVFRGSLGDFEIQPFSQ